MNEAPTEEEKVRLEKLDQQIEALKKQKLAAEEPKEDPNEIVGIIPDTSENRKVMEESDKHEDEYADDALEEILVKEVSKNTGIPKAEFEGGIYITWIDNRYHINGVRGIPNGNRIIVRSLDAVDSLIRHLQYARDTFKQPKMIDTKHPE